MSHTQNNNRTSRSHNVPKPRYLPKIYLLLEWAQKVQTQMNLAQALSRRHSEIELHPEMERKVAERPASELQARQDDKPCLVIDLDDTLIHAGCKRMAEDSFPVRVRRRRVFVNVRPGAINALKQLSKIYELFIFTASQREYAEPIIDHIAPFIPKENRFYSDSCDYCSGYAVKDLNRLRRPLNRTILIDDVIGSGLRQPKNVVGVEPWNGEQDDCLMQSILLPLLTSVRMADNIVDTLRHTIRHSCQRGLTLCDL